MNITRNGLLFYSRRNSEAYLHSHIFQLYLNNFALLMLHSMPPFATLKQHLQPQCEEIGKESSKKPIFTCISLIVDFEVILVWILTVNSILLFLFLFLVPPSLSNTKEVNFRYLHLTRQVSIEESLYLKLEYCLEGQCLLPKVEKFYQFFWITILQLSPEFLNSKTLL